MGFQPDWNKHRHWRSDLGAKNREKMECGGNTLLAVSSFRLAAIALALGADGLGKIGQNLINDIFQRRDGNDSGSVTPHADRVGHPLHRQTGDQQTDHKT